MANQVPAFEPVNEQDRQLTEVTRLETNFDRIQAVLELLRGQLNSNSDEINALEAGGSAGLPASLVTVDRAAFDALLADFTGTQAQELFEFIDGLDLTPGVVPQASIDSFASDALSGFQTDLPTFITTANIPISYALTLPEQLTSVRLVINGVEVPIELPLEATVTDFTVPILAGTRNAISAAIANEELVSFLIGRRTDGSIVETARLTLAQGTAPFTNPLYFGIIDDDSISVFNFNNDMRIDFDANSQADISLGPFPEGNPQTEPRGQFIAFAIPLIQDLQLVSVTNNDVLGLDETAAFGLFGGLRNNNTPDGRTWEIFTAGPIVPGVTLNLRITVRGLP